MDFRSAKSMNKTPKIQPKWVQNNARRCSLICSGAPRMPSGRALRTPWGPLGSPGVAERVRVASRGSPGVSTRSSIGEAWGRPGSPDVHVCFKSYGKSGRFTEQFKKFWRILGAFGSPGVVWGVQISVFRSKAMADKQQQQQQQPQQQHQ